MKTPAKIVVLGDIVLDHYIHGSTTRVNPEAPAPVVDAAREERRLGGAANVANNVWSLGADVLLLSAMDDDLDGRWVRSELESQGIAADGIVLTTNRPTTVKTRVVVDGQQVVRVDWDTRAPIDESTEARLERLIDCVVPEADIVLISDYAKGVVTERIARHAVRCCREHGVTVVVDPKHDIDKFAGATVLKPNLIEARNLTGRPIRDSGELQLAAESLRQRLQVDHVLITQGAQGLTLVGDDLTQCDATATNVVDVTGAGDTTLAAFGWALANGKSMGEAARIANLAAGVSVQKFGTACVAAHELEAPAIGSHLKSVEELAEITRDLQARGRRVVFTNGCFDLLHVGHLSYLRQSRQCGDVLIVGINSDDSVRRLKGPERPVFSHSDRSQIVAALSHVDYVFVFEEDTPYEAIRKIRPDVLTKGADYALHEVVGRELVDEVRLIPLVFGKSTTQSIHRINKVA
ncbi:MAG: bifunctional heptose 7-phosphate kinase/heptose 1-phosphate adenyltransferase [Planctomycetales bacterium]|nr:bifunctional heptose 7-phosphate kinase/heptose 1-phosphate adenyltransferase [Planctomycetales bacterium]